MQPREVSLRGVERLEKLPSVNPLTPSACADTVDRNAWNSFEIGYEPFIRVSYASLRT